MLLFSRKHNNCYCAFCKTPRRIYPRKSISLRNVIESALASGVLMFVLWQEFDPRVTVVFVVCLAMAEAFVKLRWRLSVVCRTCGFDPVIYLKDPGAAAEKVKAQLDIRKQDPKYLLAKPLNLPAISAEKNKALAEKEKGRLVSRSI